MAKYDFKPYYCEFPKLFKDEQRRLRSFLGNSPVIEHFGSSAVPGLGGKGIIDIFVAVPRDQMKSTSELLLKAGYGYRETGGDSERLFHQRTVLHSENITQIYHVHVTFLENENFKQAILFRNYLRTHETDRLEYARVKEIGAKLVEGVEDKKSKKELYMKAKETTVAAILKKAIESSKKS
ncbi:MAG: GrpB family protein [Patescibacteria group bacterium]|jgi:GrpB-like predicted nucleotidyltransferase (UPF0157 family)